MTSDPKLVLAYQRSDVYTPEYVHRIVDRATIPVEVIGEDRWPGWWCKMGLFDPQVKGDFLFCDLDTILVGDVEPLAQANQTMMLRDFFHPERPASGVMFLTEEDRAKVWKRWIQAPAHWMKRFGRGGDGAFLSAVLQPTQFLQDHFPGWICSYKVDCRQAPPPTARMICYHGNPRPHVTGWATGNSARWVRGVPATAIRCANQGVAAA